MPQIFYNFPTHKPNSNFSKVNELSSKRYRPRIPFCTFTLFVATFLVVSCYCSESSAFTSSFFSKSSISPKLAGIIKSIKPKLSKSYKDLTCSEEQKAHISYIISTMGKKHWMQLISYQGELRERGSHIQTVHPLKFLEVVFADPELKSYMPHILSQRFTRNGFINGLTPNMNSELAEGNIKKYLKDFMKAVGLDQKHHDTLLGVAKKDNWEEFVRFLITH